MKIVAITGGAGFIGSNLVNELTQNDYEVIVVDDLSTGLLNNINLNKIRFCQTSILDLDKLKQILKKVEVIVHLGARGSVPRSISDPYTTHQVNTLGTINILEVAKDTGAHVIFSSSSSVYGRNNEIPKHEKMWTAPISPYAASKLSAEAFVDAYGSTYGFAKTIFRFFNVFGPNQRPDHIYSAVIPKWILQVMKNKPINLYGDGFQSRDFTYVKTVVKVLVSAIEQNLNYNGAINLAFGNEITLNRIIELIEAKFGKIKVNKLENRQGDIKMSLNSPKLVKSLFPEIVPTPFEDGFESTLNWLKNNYKSFEV